MTFVEAMDYISSFDKLGAPVRDLNRISALLELLGNPQRYFKSIHIAGTNGKGSVAEMCSCILVDAGYKVGLFTSPYIIEYSDRIRINGENINQSCLCEAVCEIKTVVDKLAYKEKFSQFEISTAIAFLYFKNKHCDIAVIETGIGGKLDSTNVLEKPVVSIITSISYDHTKILGKTLKEIATQKSGIIKCGCPCVLSVKNENDVVEVIREVAIERGSDLIIPDQSKLKICETGLGGNKFVYKNSEYITSMSGEHQIINALSVIEAMSVLSQNGFSIRQENVRNGINMALVVSRAEIIRFNPLVILDGAHNQAGMKALAKLVKNIEGKRKICIVGMLRDKDYENSIAEITDCFDEFLCVDSFHEKAVNAYELSEFIEKKGKKSISISDTDVIKQNKSCLISHGIIFVVCGSLYLTSEVRKILTEEIT